MTRRTYHADRALFHLYISLSFLIFTSLLGEIDAPLKHSVEGRPSTLGKDRVMCSNSLCFDTFGARISGIEATLSDQGGMSDTMFSLGGQQKLFLQVVKDAMLTIDEDATVVRECVHNSS